MFCVIQPILRKIYLLLLRIKIKYVFLGFFIIVVLDFFGLFTHIFELSYDDNFSYPYDGNIQECISQLRANEKPDVEPINDYNYSFIYELKNKCQYENPRLIFVVKSGVENFDKRIGIRNSWGFEKRFYDVPVRTVFLLGWHPNDPETQARVKAEGTKYGDIIQADFVDAYFNNTIKTMMGFKWAMKYCRNSKFYMFVDDDMYVSLKNVLRFIRHPTGYPDYLKPGKEGVDSSVNQKEKEKRLRRATAREKIAARKKPGWFFHNKTKFHYTEIEDNNVTNKNTRSKRQIFDFELPEDVRLFAGFVFKSSPHRHKSSKWYVSLDEYPYHLWPPYVTAGAYILSKEALIDLYYASFYTKHFRFDDIYLGLVAKKADIEPFHSDDFYFYKKDYNKFNYKYVIASHGYGDPNELIQVWNEQKAMGYA